MSAPKSSLFGQTRMTLLPTQILGVPMKVWTRSRREPMLCPRVRHRCAMGLAYTFHASLDDHSPVFSSNLQTLILDAEYELTNHNEDVGCRRPLVETARREVQPVEIVRSISDEVVVRVLDETGLHRAPVTNGTRSRRVGSDRKSIAFEWVNSTLTLTKLPSSKLMACPPSHPRMWLQILDTCSS